MSPYSPWCWFAAALAFTVPGAAAANERALTVAQQESAQSFEKGSADSSAGGGFFRNLARGATSLLGRPSAVAPTGATATIGIRGLTAEQMRNAQPNPGALQQMEGNAVNGGEAASFAQAASLKPQNMQYLAGPPRPASSNRNPLTGETP